MYPASGFCAHLESLYTVKGIVGSNPTLLPLQTKIDFNKGTLEVQC